MSDSQSEPQTAPKVTNPEGGPSDVPKKKPIVCLVIGMAGSGKSTLMTQVTNYMVENKMAPYILNLDPAVTGTDYETNIDIRDTVNYKQVMQQYNLGPNGAIMTSLNLFATRFDQVVSFVENKQEEIKFAFVDTPGQIEIFTWSASGQLITEAFASTFPTCVLYVVDTARCTRPTTFMANMSYACSILYKTQLPFVLVFNKTDILSADFALEWVRDCDTFSDAIRNDTSYSASLSKSMSLMMEEFYQNLQCVQFSAVTGKGLSELFSAIQKCSEEYYESYLPDMLKRKEAAKKAEEERKVEALERLAQDWSLDKNKDKSKPDEYGDGEWDDDMDDDMDDGMDDGVDEAEREEFEEFMNEIKQRKAAYAQSKGKQSQ